MAVAVAVPVPVGAVVLVVVVVVVVVALHPRCDAQTSYFLDLLCSEMLCFTALFSVVMDGNSSWFRVYFS